MKPEIERLLSKLAGKHVELAATLGLKAAEVRGVCEELGYQCKPSVMADLLDMCSEIEKRDATRLGFLPASQLYTTAQGLEMAQDLEARRHARQHGDVPV